MARSSETPCHFLFLPVDIYLNIYLANSTLCTFTKTITSTSLTKPQNGAEHFLVAALCTKCTMKLGIFLANLYLGRELNFFYTASNIAVQANRTKYVDNFLLKQWNC